MKTVLPLRYLLVPAIIAWIMVFITSALFIRIKTDEIQTVLAWASVFAIIAALLTVFLVTPFIAKLARGEPLYFFREEREFRKDTQFVVRAETHDKKQVDFFHGLKPKQWRECAIKLEAHIRAGNTSFPYAVVGQTERPILVPIMLAAEYIVPAGTGEYDLTEKGINWWLTFAAIPYPYHHVPDKLRRLVVDYT